MGEKPNVKVSRSRRRALANYVGLDRIAIQSHFRMAVDNLPPGVPYPVLQNFDDSQIWAWIKTGIAATYKTDIRSRDGGDGSLWRPVAFNPRTGMLDSTWQVLRGAQDVG